MRFVDSHRAIRVSARTRPRWRAFPAALAVLFAVALAAQAQSPCPFQPGTPGNPQKGFYANFANPTYEIAMPLQSGTGWQSDRNSTYSPLFYSIANANRNFPPNCQFELVIVGDFPDARYFSITVNDAHNTATQHLMDAAIDPVGNVVNGVPAYSQNPFVPDANGSSPSYTGAQPYLVPISLGAVPSLTAVTPGCQINSFEEDNLLDATQRHLSNDWNTNLQPPNITSGLAPHVVNTPGNGNENTAGSIIVRTYLPWVTCPGGPNTCTTQPIGGQPSLSQPHFIVRDVATGCAFTAQEVANNLLYYKQCNGTCATPDTAIVSMTDLSAFDPNWMDVSQETQHSYYASITPQACYANGNPTQTNPPSSGPPYFYNRVAWARSPEWLTSEAPDDSYIGGAVSPTDLAHMQAAAKNPACPQVNKGDGCVMRLRFQLPNMPTTPCGRPYTCALTSDVDLRYSSLTFWYYKSGIGGLSPSSIISLSDAAFARSSNGLVTLLVNVANSSPAGQGGLPSWLQQTQAPSPCATVPPTGNCLVQQGVSPVANDALTNRYSMWTVNGYTVLDLTQFEAFQDICPNGICGLPLLLELRNTLPSSTFMSSGAAVPFNTAEYTNADGAGGGLMGPYVPLVDYVDPNDPSLPPSGAPSFSLPASTSLPASPPNFNAPALSPFNDCVSAGKSCVNFPNQYWSSTSTQPPNLYCPTGAPTEPETAIYFVATQFPTPALTYFLPSAPPGETPCTSQPGYCNQIVAASLQTAQEPGGTAFQPPVTVTVAGTGFGYLSQLPQAVQGSPYLDLNDCAANAVCPPYTWDSATATSCQLYIANWTDSSISLVANLAAGVQNQYQQYNLLSSVLSLFSDLTPLTFLAAPGCPINAGDNLTFTVTNPQNGATSSIAATVLPAGTMPY